MNASRQSVAALTIIVLLAVLAGFLYVQSEINGSTTSPSTSTSSSPSTGSSSPQSNVANPITITNTTTTTYGGTTLVCTSQSYSIDGGKTIFYIIDANITNIGDATAYGIKLREQGYYSNGTQAFDTTIPLNAYYIRVPGIRDPVNMPPGQTYHIPFTLDPSSKTNEPFGILSGDVASYTITPVWSTTPVN